MSRTRRSRRQSGSASAGVLVLVLAVTGVAIAALAVARSPGDGAAPAAAETGVAVQAPTGEAGAAPSDHPTVKEDPGRSAEVEAPARKRGPLWTGEGYRIATVRKGTKVPVYDAPGGSVAGTAGPKTEFGSDTSFSVLDRRGNWLAVSTPIAADNEPLWIRADRRRLTFATTTLSIHADLGDRTVQLRNDGEVLTSFPVSIGAAGTDTPTGRFAVTDVIVGGLSPVYGCCALALTAHQPSLPADWIGGDRVAIHGTTGPVGLASSTGCLRATNRDVYSLVGAIPLGVPVFIEA